MRSSLPFLPTYRAPSTTTTTTAAAAATTTTTTSLYPSPPSHYYYLLLPPRLQGAKVYACEGKMRMRYNSQELRPTVIHSRADCFKIFQEVFFHTPHSFPRMPPPNLAVTSMSCQCGRHLNTLNSQAFERDVVHEKLYAWALKEAISATYHVRTLPPGASASLLERLRAYIGCASGRVDGE